MMMLSLTLMRHLLYDAKASGKPSTSPSAKPSISPSHAPAVIAEGLELFAMAKAIPRLQSLDGAYLT